MAVCGRRLAMLRDALGRDARRVRCADMRELGRNPGRIIPAWHDFIAAHRRRSGGIRGIGEPIWAGREPDELVECQLHEALLNLAFADVAGFRLLCPYDVTTLPAEVVREARCSHPHVVDRGSAGPSSSYRGVGKLLAPFEVPLAARRGPAEVLGFDAGELIAVRHLVQRRASAACLAPDRLRDSRHRPHHRPVGRTTSARLVAARRLGALAGAPALRPGQVRSDPDGTTVRMLIKFA